MTDTSQDFLRISAEMLRDVYLARIARALEVLPAADLWWRPHGEATSAGNLLAHLEGNVRQWILAGLGGARDTRRRATEFAAGRTDERGPLLARLRETVIEASVVIEDFDATTLHDPLTIQGFATTPFAAIYHVVEHFSWHTGQVVWIAKMRAGPAHGIAFYDDRKLNAERGA